MAASYGHIRFLRTAAVLALAALREGRLSRSPRRWLIDLRHLRGQMRARALAPDSPLPSAGASREALTRRRLRELDTFLSSRERIVFTPATEPVLSVLLVLFNRAELTLACLRALAKEQAIPLELVVVDNASADRTTELLDRVDGARIERWPENRGFLLACNAAARLARGELLVFLNSDAELLPGALEEAVAGIGASPDIGAVGGRLILPGGDLQEAGSIIWADGSCEGYGRGRRPDEAEFLFDRDVDYCSAALLVTPRRVFLDLGAFDERYVPAYYEDADYCVRLWQSGRRVVYRPGLSAVHFEFASAGSAGVAVGMQRARHGLFVETHREWLTGHHHRRCAGALVARDRTARTGRVLLIDDRPPDRSAGFGFPRSAALVQALDDLGYFVTVYGTSAVAGSTRAARADVPRTVEVITEPGSQGLTAFFGERRGFYDRIIVSRAHNLDLLRARLGPPTGWCGGARLVYDAEAIAAFRDVERRRLSGQQVGEAEIARLVRAEASLTVGVDTVLAVSPSEQQALLSAGCTNVHVVGHGVPVAPTERPFSRRKGILFVGAFHELSPNADAVLWFARQVLPRIRDLVDQPVEFTVVGPDPPADILALRGPGIDIRGGVRDLEPFYDAARVFVASTRFAAGIPLKVIHAAAAGVPVVATGLLGRQLGWTGGRDLLIADEPDAFASACASLFTDSARWHEVRSAALARVQTDFSPRQFRAQLERALA